MQHAVQHGADQQQAKGVQQAYQRHERHRAQQLYGVWPNVPQSAESITVVVSISTSEPWSPAGTMIWGLIL